MWARRVGIAVLLCGVAAASAVGVTGAGTITTFAGTPGLSSLHRGDGGPATAAGLTSPIAVATGAQGEVFIADRFAGLVRRVAPDGTITTAAGDGATGTFRDGAPATSVALDPTGVAADAQGNLYIADRRGAHVLKVSPQGTITSIAGNGGAVYSGDGGPATSAGLDPLSIAVDGKGNVYVGDDANFRVRRISPAGTITTVAGTGRPLASQTTSIGDGGPATSAVIGAVAGNGTPTNIFVAVDGRGDLFISDQGQLRVREVTPDGVIRTVAGTGLSGSAGDGGPATAATFRIPAGVALDPGGTLYVADVGALRVRAVAPGGAISTVAGNGTQGPSGDGGPASAAGLVPVGLATDAGGDLYVADAFNRVVRRISGATTAGSADLAAVIPSPRTLAVGPVRVTAPGRVSLRSLRRSKCVLVRVRSASPARVLVTIFSGRRSIRLFGQKRVVFRAAGRRTVCIPVPLRAHTFTVRTPLRVALGVALGATPRPGERKPKPAIRPIRLTP